MKRFPIRMIACLLTAAGCFASGLSIIYLSDAYQRMLRTSGEHSGALLWSLLGTDAKLVSICLIAALLCLALLAALILGQRKDKAAMLVLILCAVSVLMVMLVFFVCVFIMLSVPDLSAGLPLSAVLLDRACLVPALLILVCVWVVVRLVEKRRGFKE